MHEAGVLKDDLRMINASSAGKRAIRPKAVRSLAILSAKLESRALPLLSGASRRVLSSMVDAMKSLNGPERLRFETLDLEMNFAEFTTRPIASLSHLKSSTFRRISFTFPPSVMSSI